MSELEAPGTNIASGNIYKYTYNLTLLVDDDVSSRRLASWRSYRTEHSLPVLGLRPGMNSRLTIVVSDALGNSSQWAGLEFTTEALPSDFPAIDATVTDFERMEPE